MRINTYYHVYSTSNTPCYLTKEADDVSQQTWLCRECCSPKPGVTTVDAILRTAPAKEPLNFVFGAGLPIASRAFLEAIGRNLVQEELYLGQVYGPDGQELKEWATFRGKRRIIVRGSKNAQYRICEECGQGLYFAMGKSYLYPAPPCNTALFESNTWGLVMTENTFLQSDINGWRGIYVDKLSVADKPKDSFGELFE